MPNIMTAIRFTEFKLKFFCTLSGLFMMAWSVPQSYAQATTVIAYDRMETVTIGLRDDLGADTDTIKKAILQNPAVRVGWPSEYEIARLPDYPRTLVLIDMQNSPPQSLKSMYEYQRRVPTRASVPSRLPVELGRLDDGSFMDELNREIGKIARTKSLIRMQSDRYTITPSTCVSIFSAQCDDVSFRENAELSLSMEVSVQVRNRSEKPKFIYVFHVTPEHELTLILNSTDYGEAALPPSAILTNGEHKLELKTQGRHRFVTISSDKPINTQIFSGDINEEIKPNLCVSDLERRLCAALSGKLPLSFEQLGNVEESPWTLSISTHYVSGVDYGYVGGGSKVPNGYAGWQVQIYSTQRYTPQQIANDTTRYLKERAEYELYHRCGGSLIAKNIVLTAAHCVGKAPFDGDRAKNVLTHRRIRAGTLNLKGGGTTYAIDSIVVHEGYVGGEHRDDIALIKIKADQNTESVRLDTIGIPSRTRQVRGGNKVRVLGWGITGAVDGGQNWRVDTDGEIQHNPNYLMIGDLKILNWEKCKKRPVYKDELDKKMLCAVSDKRAARQSATGAVFSCVGDSGGPVVREIWIRKRGERRRSLERKEQIGIVSWAYGCGTINPNSNTENPSVFVDVARYTGWINDAKNSFVSGEVIRQ